MPAPVNDLCPNATILPGTLPYTLTGFDTTLATQSVDDPLNTVAGEVPFNTVWFRWTAPSTQLTRLNTFGSDYDTVLGVYTGPCGGPFVTIAENDDDIDNSPQSQVVFLAIAGTTYQIVVGSFAAGGGSLTLHAIEEGLLTALPTSLTRNMNVGGVTQTGWYGYVATAADDGIGLFAFGDLATYLAKTTIYENSFTAPLLNLAGIVNLAVQFPVVAGRLYLAKIESVSGNVSPAVLTLHVDRALRLDAPIGTIAISDDTPGFPLALLDGATGAPLRFLTPFPAGEGGDVLPTGESAWVDSLLNHAVAFPADFSAPAGSIALAPTDRVLSIRTNRTTKFYVGSPGDKVYITDAAGALLTTEALAVTSLSGAAPSLNETILYYTSALAAAAPVKRWDLVAHVGLTDLVAGVAGAKITRPLLVLLDGTILVPYFTTAGPITEVRRYTAAGALLNTYSFPLNTNTDFQLASALDDPATFWVWERRANAISGFVNVRVSDGARVIDFSAIQYRVGTYGGAPTATPLAYFGHSESCPFLLLRVPVTIPVPPPPPPPGCGPTTDVTIGCANDLPVAPSSEGPGCATDVPTSPLRMQEAA